MDNYYERVLKLANAINGIETNIEGRRNVWKENRVNVTFVFEGYIEMLKNGMAITMNQDASVQNMESISFVMPDRPSGIIDKDGEKIRIGGSLTFAQSSNGYISVIMKGPKFPFADSVADSIMHGVDPRTITRDYVQNQVVRFLEYLAALEY